MRMGRLEGKNILVTAAGRGIGRACALAASAEGAHVIATDMDRSALDRLDSTSIKTAVLDGTDCEAVRSLVENSPGFDTLIHCIGYVHDGTALDCDLKSWRRSFEINVESFYFAACAVLPGMQKAGRGSIVCISSVASSLKGLPRRAAYGASKSAVNGLVKSLAADYIGSGIRCNAVCPGTVSSPSLEERITALGEELGGYDKAHDKFISRQPMMRFGTPEEVASLCIYLASDESSFVTGQLLAIDGGITI
ncbi:MAG: putative short-chain dehydrogenase/reductase protein [Gammaproteobacteria bacterium]|nr:putative short-chain dehydrogenase/reductase protein [Gammaproteobacteria bacterium]